MRLVGIVLCAAIVAVGCSDDGTGQQLDELQAEVQELRAELVPPTTPTSTSVRPTNPADDVTAALDSFWGSFHPDQEANWCDRYRDPGERDYLFGLAREADPTLYGSLTYLEFASFFDEQCG